PERPPRVRDRAAGKPGGTAADKAGYQKDLERRLRCVEFTHLEHDPEKWEPVFGKRSCSSNNVKRDETSSRFRGSAFEIGRADLRALEQLAAGAGEREQAVDHDVAAVGELERVERVLLDQEHGELVLAVEVADRGENLFDQERREAERGLVEQEESRPAH